MPIHHAVLFLAGLAALVAGGDGLVRGASATARALGVSSLVVGLTVVSFGTSAPELAVSMTSGLSSSAALALGNVVGSNIFNVLLVLGMAALARPLPIKRQLVAFDLPIMVGVSVLLVLLSLSGTLGRPTGLLLTAILLTWLFQTVRNARKSQHVEAPSAAPTQIESAEGGQISRADVTLVVVSAGLLAISIFTGHLTYRLGGGLIVALLINPALGLAGQRPRASLIVHLLQIAVGIGVIVGAASCLVDGAVGIARWLGVSDAVIGLTVVAAGTSLPEAVTSLVASVRRESDLAVGNVVGSNIFNVLCIVGLTATVVDLPVAPELLQFDYAAMLVVTIGLWLLAWRQGKLTRAHGAMMLTVFVGYLVVQVMRTA